MKNKSPFRFSVYLLLFAIPILCGLVIPVGRSGVGKSTLDQNQTIRPVVQTAVDRIWVKSVKKVLLQIGAEGNRMLLFLPRKVLADDAGNIYVFDFDDRNVKRFTKDGKLTTRYGYRRGKGPGEFSNPTDFDIAADGSVWVCDPINGNLTIFHENGTLKNTIRGKNEVPYRVVLNNDGSFVVRPSGITNHLFSLYSAKGNLIERFGSFFDDQPKIEIALDGSFARGANNIFVYIFSRVGMFVSYQSNSTTPLLIAQTINYKGLPKIITKQVGDSRIKRVDPKAPYATLSASIVHDEIHLLVGSDNEPNRSIVDVYNLNTGYYRHSYDLPSDVSFAHVTKDRIYTIRDTTLTVWSR